MLKLNSRSLVGQDSHQGPIKDHLNRLVVKQEQWVREQLLRQQEKESRIEAVEKNFINWVQRKGEQLRDRQQRHSRNKEEQISKIVKKCKEHEKYLGEKLKNYQNKKKASLREAWKMAEKYKNSVDDFHASKDASKHASREKSISRVKMSQELAESQLLPEGEQREYLSVHYKNPNFSKVYGNASKQYWAELNQSVRQLKFTQQPTFSTEIQQRQERESATDKLQQTLARWKQHTIESEQAKIQQLGERLKKIERGRMRKFELVKKKREKQTTTNEDEDREIQRSSKKQDRSERVHSQAMIRQRRVRDYSDLNKHKREEYFQNQLQHGTDYLESQKIKFLKSTLAKKVAVSAIQKKLYFERLQH